MRVQVYGWLFTHLLYIGPFIGRYIIYWKIPWWWHVWCAETCWRLIKIWCVYFGACNVGYV